MKKRYWFLLAVFIALGLQELDSVLFGKPLKVSVTDDQAGSYLELELKRRGWLTQYQTITVTYGHPTSLFTEDKREQLGRYTIMEPVKYIQYEDLTPTWRTPQLLVVHTRHHPDLVINLAQHQLEGAVPH